HPTVPLWPWAPPAGRSGWSLAAMPQRRARAGLAEGVPTTPADRARSARAGRPSQLVLAVAALPRTERCRPVCRPALSWLYARAWHLEWCHYLLPVGHRSSRRFHLQWPRWLRHHPTMAAGNRRIATATAAPHAAAPRVSGSRPVPPRARPRARAGRHRERG